MTTAFQLVHTSVDDLKSTIDCMTTTGHPIPIAMLREAIKLEYGSRGCRSSIIKLLEREIRRQEKAA